MLRNSAGSPSAAPAGWAGLQPERGFNSAGWVAGLKSRALKRALRDQGCTVIEFDSPRSFVTVSVTDSMASMGVLLPPLIAKLNGN